MDVWIVCDNSVLRDSSRILVCPPQFPHTAREIGLKFAGFPHHLARLACDSLKDESQREAENDSSLCQQKAFWRSTISREPLKQIAYMLR